MRLNLFVILILLSVTSCPDEVSGVKHLVVKNNSSSRIFFWYSGDFSSFHYPDTLLPEIIPIEITGLAEGGGSIGTQAGQRPTWDLIYSQLPEKLFSIYFFDIYPKTQEDWDLFRDNPEFIHRKDISLETLKLNNYTIYYP